MSHGGGMWAIKSGISMKIAIGIMVYNEESCLVKYLNAYYQGYDGIVAVDTGSTDSSVKILRVMDADVTQIRWTNFSNGYNTVVRRAEELGYDYLLMLDADESITKDTRSLLNLVASPDYAIAFPTFEFMRDREHIDLFPYPDFHTRFIPLNKGFYYRGVNHAIIFRDGNPQCAIHSREAMMYPFIHVYHFGKLKPMEEIHLHYVNSIRTNEGKPRLTICPKDIPNTFENGPVVKFLGPPALCM